MLEKLRKQTTSVSAAYHQFQAHYHDDPAGFVCDCIDWRKGERPTSYQLEIMRALSDHRRISVRGPHGLGKTALASWIILWFALTRDGEDWKIAATAGAWRQVTKFLWPELHKWARHLKWQQIGRPPFSQFELLSLDLKLKTGEAFSVVSDNSDLIEGAHADHILFVFDESKSIQTKTFDAAEGALATGDAYALAISTPGEPSGRFYDIQSHKSGYEDWWTRHVTLDETLAAGRVSATWVAQRRTQWGEQSAVYQNRVKGEFASSEEDGVISLSWIEQANERWRDWEEADKPGDFVAVGVDVARSGEDKTVLAMLYGNAIAELRRYSKEDTMQTTGRVDGILQAHGGRAIVDVIGIGAGVVDRLREMGRDVYPFNASEGTNQRDHSGELGFVNARSAAWWNMRELLDPANSTPIALPPDDMLTGDLTAPHWRVMSGGRIQIESKDDIKKRIGRSTDDGDAVVMAYFGKGMSHGIYL